MNFKRASTPPGGTINSIYNLEVSELIPAIFFLVLGSRKVYERNRESKIFKKHFFFENRVFLMFNRASALSTGTVGTLHI